jgi:hypothetical protein
VTKTLTKTAEKMIRLQMTEALRQAAEPRATYAARKCCLETARACAARLGIELR